MSIQSVRKKYEDQLMQLPNVTIVGIGKKGGKDVIKIFVTHKVPESELEHQEIVPKKLDGYGTDVEEVGVVTTQRK